MAHFINRLVDPRINDEIDKDITVMKDLPKWVKSVGQRKQFLIRFLAENKLPSGWYELASMDDIWESNFEITRIHFKER